MVLVCIPLLIFADTSLYYFLLRNRVMCFFHFIKNIIFYVFMKYVVMLCYVMSLLLLFYNTLMLLLLFS